MKYTTKKEFDKAVQLLLDKISELEKQVKPPLIKPKVKLEDKK